MQKRREPARTGLARVSATPTRYAFADRFALDV